MQKYFTGVGRRKTAVAQTRIQPSKANVVNVNGENIEIFPKLEKILNIADKSFNISVIVRGGGIVAQKDAIALGVARAITKFDETLKSTLRKNGWLTRNPREKERKKPGLKGARRAPQWAKR